MSEISKKKRKIPRHIDGRIMVGPIALKNFFIILPLIIAIAAVIIKYFTPIIFFAGVFFMGILIGLFSEFHHKETGFLILKDFLSYFFSGDKFFERNALNASVIKRLSKNKIKRQQL